MLNEPLYAALVTEFGQRNVRIKKANNQGKWKYKVFDGRLYAERVHGFGGQEFQLDCPYCSDTRSRLTLSYRWGTYDAKSDSKNLHLISCYNEECMRDSGRRWNFYERLFGRRLYGPELDEVLSNAQEESPKRQHSVSPGTLWRMDVLARKQPRHPAVLYLENRLISPHYVGEHFGVGYCPQSTQYGAEDRIVVPIVQHGKLRGWTARYVGEPSKESGIRKWMHMSGLDRENLLYNFDVAKDYQTKILVEGPGSAWGVGGGGMAILGKTIGGGQIELLKSCFRPGDIIALMLDPKQHEKEVKAGNPHHMHVALQTLLAERRFDGRIVPVWLPPWLDPGDADRELSFRLISQAAAAKGFTADLHD